MRACVGEPVEVLREKGAAEARRRREVGQRVIELSNEAYSLGETWTRVQTTPGSAETETNRSAREDEVALAVKRY